MGCRYGKCKSRKFYGNYFNNWPLSKKKSWFWISKLQENVKKAFEYAELFNHFLFKFYDSFDELSKKIKIQKELVKKPKQEKRILKQTSSVYYSDKNYWIKILGDYVSKEERHKEVSNIVRNYFSQIKKAIG